MKYLEIENQRRRQIAERYNREIINPNIILPLHPDVSLQHVWHLYVVRLTKREDFQSYLNKNNIQSLIHYPIPSQTNGFEEFNNYNLPITEKLSKEVLSLPMSPFYLLTNNQKLLKL